MQTISVATKFGKIEKVPLTKWRELTPYWPKITKAFFEVLMENDFSPYTATIERPEGFVADRHYWERSMKNPEETPLGEAKRFVSKLIGHPDFAEAIKAFNASKKVNWLKEENVHILGGYVYSFYYTLKPVLKIVEKNSKKVLKPSIY